MSKVKNVLCLVLALAIVFALAVPAFAEGGGDVATESVQPRAYICHCGALLEPTGIITGPTRENPQTVNSCSKKSGSHTHYTLVTRRRYVCSDSSCGGTRDIIESRQYNYCP